MQPINKKIVTDEDMRPVAVLIDYQDWQKIEKILHEYQAQEANFDLNPLSALHFVIYLDYKF